MAPEFIETLNFYGWAMGGMNSTRWNGYTRKQVVEDCLTLDVRRVLSVADRTALACIDDDHIPPLLIEDEGGNRTYIDLTYFNDPLTGARRWYFLCPTCSARRCCVQVTGAHGVGCRDCLNLSYRARQDADRRWLERHIPGYQVAVRLDRLEQDIARRCYLTQKQRGLLAEYKLLLTHLEKQNREAAASLN